MKKQRVAKSVLVAAVWGLSTSHAEVAIAQTRAMGVDCSFSQLNWQSTANSGFEFGWAESTNGSTTRAAFAYNITAAPQATFTYNGTVTHFLIGAYHFDHPDLQISSGMTPSQDLGYFLSAAGASMTAGHMLPILDQEVTAAAGALSFSDYATQFADLLYAAKGIRPIFYSSESLTSQLSSAAATHMAGLWIGRPTFTDSQAQTGNPDQAVSNPYGGFGSYASQPWNFWQYADDVTVGSGNVDKDVAHGDLDYLLNYTIPALWTSGTSGNWNTTSNWNCVNLLNNAATIPGSIENCNVSLVSAAAGSINITLSSGTQNIRSIVSSYNLTLSGTGKINTAKNATLNSGGTTTISGGTLVANTLTINSGATLNQTSGAIAAQNWVWVGTTYAGSIQNNGTLNLSGGAVTGPLINAGTLTAGTVTVTGAVSHTATTAMVVSTGGTMTINGDLTLGDSSVNLTPGSGSTSAKMVLAGNLIYNGSGSGASIVSATGAGQSLGLLSLGNGARTFTVNNGGGAPDLQIDAIIASGSLIKSGTGTMVLTAPETYSGLAINGGAVQIQNDTGLGSVPGSPTNNLTFAGGTLQTNSTFQIGTNRSIVNSGGMTIDTNGFDVTYAGAISGNGTFTKIGGGALILSGSNPAGGAVTINQGLLRIGANNLLGTAGVTTTENTSGTTYGGTIQLSGGVSYNLPLAIGGAGVNNGSVNAPGSTGALDNFSGNNTWLGNITLNGTGSNAGDALLNQIGASNGTLTVGGVIANGTGNTLAKTGNGDVVFTGASPNTYSNITRVLGGRLIIEKDGALGAAGSTTATVGNTFMLSGSSSTIAFRAPAASSGFSYSTFEVLEVDGNNSTSGQLDNLGGNNTFTGNIGLGGTNSSGSVKSYLGVSAGSLELSGQLSGRISSGSSSVPRAITKLGTGTLILSGDSSGSVVNTSNGVLLNSSMQINAGTVLLKGNFAAPGITSWTANSGGTLNLSKVNAIGSSSIALNSGILQLGVPMSFSNALSINNSGTIDTGVNNATYAGSIASSSGGLIKSGTGNLAVTNVRTTGLTVGAGTLAVASGGGTAGTSVLSSLSITGTMDLADHSMIVNYSGGSPATTIRSYIASGYNGGAWNGASGLTSSAAAGDTNFITGLGYAEASQLGVANGGSFAGQHISGQAVVVKYTYYGDNDLDGKVTLNDFSIFVDGFNGLGNGWVYGDYNYSGAVDLNDFSTFVDSFKAQGSSLSNLDAAISGDANLSEAQKNAMLAVTNAVPEPGTISLALIGAVAGLARRRRNA